MKTKLSRIGKVIVFVILFFVIFAFVAALFKPKWLENRWQSAKTNKSFYALEKDSMDVVFLGSSVIAAAVDPFQLYNEYGITSYNLGVMQQPMMGTYYWLKEVLQTQNPKVVVVEVKTAGRVSDKDEADARKSYDYMAWGPNKVKYALENTLASPDNYDLLSEEGAGYNLKTLNNVLTKTNLFEYLYPMSLYHSRWSELTADDYDFVMGNNKSNTRGFATLTTKSGVEFGPINIKSDEQGEYNETNERYLRGIIKKCQENNIEVVLVKTADSSWSYKKYNFVNNIAKEYSVDYIDFNVDTYFNEVGYDYTNDAADSVHMNLIGAQKTTTFIGKYLTDNFKLTDYRTEKGKVHDLFESELSIYNDAYEDAQLCMEYDLTSYLNKIDNDRYTIAIINGCKFNGIFTNEQKEALLKLGMSETMYNSLTSGQDIISVLSNNKELVAEKLEETEETGTTGISKDGYFNDKMNYSMTASSAGCKVQFGTSNKIADSKKVNIAIYDKNTNEIADVCCLKVAEDGSVSLGR